MAFFIDSGLFIKNRGIPCGKGNNQQADHTSRPESEKLNANGTEPVNWSILPAVCCRIQKLFLICQTIFLYMRNFYPKRKKKILIFPFQSVTNWHVFYCAWIIFFIFFICSNFTSRQHSYVVISLCGGPFYFATTIFTWMSFCKANKNILAVLSILLYDYTKKVITSLLECMCCTGFDNLYLWINKYKKMHCISQRSTHSWLFL